MRRTLTLLRTVATIAATLIAAFLAYWLFTRTDAPADVGNEQRVERAVAVTPAPARLMTFEERIPVQGNVRARNFALVSALMGGTIEVIWVDEGDTVIANETRLFTVDAIKLQKSFEVSRQDLAVARNGRIEKQARLEQVQADFHKAEVDLRRYELLYEDNVIPIDTLEMQQSRFKQTRAMLRHAETLVQLGREQEHQAEIALEIANKNLNDTTVYAPISGVVTNKLQEVGEMANAGHPVMRIEDPSLLEVSAFLPAQYYPRVVEGDTLARIEVYGIDVGLQRITYKSPSINTQLRSFEIRSILQEHPEGVVSGAIAEITVLFESRTAMGVPRESVLTRSDGNIVFKIENNRAIEVRVEPDLETDGYVEIPGDVLIEGDAVAAMGQFLLEDGMSVIIQGDEER